MATILVDGFNVNSGVPLDAKSVKADITARNAIPALQRYIGLTVYVIADNTSYRLVGGILDANWEEAGGGSGSGILTVADYTAMLALPDDDRYDGLIVYVIDVQENWQLRGGIDDLDYVNLDQINVPVTSTIQTLTGGGVIDRVGGNIELKQVQGTSGETTVTLDNTPAPSKGDQLFIQGMSDANPIILDLTYITIYLTANLIAHLIYDGTAWRKVGGV